MLPIVLAGPIIRRVDRKDFWIWIATSVELQLRVLADVYAPTDNSRGAFKKVEEGVVVLQQTIRLSERIFVSLMKVSLRQQEFPSGGYVEYELEGDRDEVTQVLKDRCRRLSLRRTTKLMFFLPFSKHDGACEILHVSCRRIRRSGSDAVAGIISHCRRRIKEMAALPSMLILGGDQIYCDDVEDNVLKEIQVTQSILFGTKTFSGSRTKFASEARFTSDAARNHLVDFEEISCLYLISWSTELRRLGSLKGVADEVSDWEAVMAHIPTYMMFDDHDVTDDWFLDKKWKDDVLNTAPGKRYIEDALAAYFVFQGWGNDPDRFSKEDVESFHNWLSQRSSRSRPPSPIVNSARWTFVIPCDWLVVCLDCRTKRSPSREWVWFEFQPLTGKAYRSPALEPIIVQPSELIAARESASASRTQRNNCSILVVNTPVFGLPLVGQIQEIWRRRSQLSSRQYAKNLELDPESWDIDPASWVELVRHLLTSVASDKWVILSGDVHYSFVADGEFVTPHDKVLKCLQITSSPTNNQTTSLRYLPYLHQFSSLEGSAVSQAIWAPRGGISRGTPPISSDEEFRELVETTSRRVGQRPYCKKWKGLVAGRGANGIVARNAYARLKVSQTSVDVSIVEAKGASALEFSWK